MAGIFVVLSRGYLPQPHCDAAALPWTNQVAHATAEPRSRKGHINAFVKPANRLISNFVFAFTPAAL